MDRLSKMCGIGICAGASAGGAEKFGPRFIIAGYGGPACAESGDGEPRTARTTAAITIRQLKRALIVI